MNRECYKVVREFFGELCSVSIDSNQVSQMWLIHYAIGKKIVPQKGKLFVFGTLEAAERFIYPMNEHEQIWLVDCENPEPINRIVLWMCLDKYGEDFWWTYKKTDQLLINHHTYLADVDAPTGTMVCDSLTMIRRVA